MATSKENSDKRKTLNQIYDEFQSEVSTGDIETVSPEYHTNTTQ